ncbi:response regulator transcription factor [uncultured Parabacteroides sp.]|uniref:response regulator transcription factor n=1 Tax=uncultured Parabacteroides sp. TaxID=512312 RepID=UPI00280555F7|nr:response regulator transcription factor [uncultured Parabacteroides sp.]
MNDSFNILIFSKDYNQGTTIQDSIKAAGYDSQVFDQEEAAYEGFLSRNFTLCIIDHDMDRKETRTLAAMIKSSENIIPVIFLCEHPTREEIALLFSFHADDVIRKPLDAEILQARIKAKQNRYRPQNKKEVKIYLFGKFKFDLSKQLLSIEDKTTKLTTKEADLLTLLCQHANNMIERMYALQVIWKSDNYFSARSMDVYITKLRKLLQDDPTIKIINVHGRGYKLSTHEDGN